MTTAEELNLFLTLIRKHNLPLSPILEYAINEKLDGILSFDGVEKGSSVELASAYKEIYKTALEEFSYSTKFVEKLLSLESPQQERMSLSQALKELKKNIGDLKWKLPCRMQE